MVLNPGATSETLAKAQSLFDDHYTRSEVSQELNIKYDTLRKAINDGRLKERKQNSSASTTKSSRNVNDAKAAGGMGKACTRIEDRVDAIFSLGNGAITRFEACLDVPKGGVLCALPALLENGLLHGAGTYAWQGRRLLPYSAYPIATGFHVIVSY